MGFLRKAVVPAAAGLLLTTVGLAGGRLPAAQAEAVTAGDLVTHEENPRVPQGAAWTEAYFPSSDGSGVELHADVLRPAHLPADTKTPVIVSVGPYFSHTGQTDPEGWDRTGPSSRFLDFIDGARLMARGYTYVMVDLRGFGGSTGCLDWLGPGEQADVRAAVEWASRQSWSTGKVGLYGKSYDGMTGLVGNNLKMDSLKAVVAQEPLWDLYNYIFTNKIPRPNVTATPEAYNAMATMPPMADDSDRYKANAAYEQNHPECLRNNLADMNNPDPNSAYWSARNLAAKAAGSTTPLLVTQGFIESNTKPEDVDDYLANHRGRERGWLGPWDHVRGNDTDAEGRLQMGRAGWFDEVMRFYDQYLRGISPTVTDPAYAIQDNLGQWRAQPTWPMTTLSYDATLSSGQYVDDGGGVSARTAPEGRWDMEHAPPRKPLPDKLKIAAQGSAANSFWTWSTPAAQKLRLTATPSIRLTANASGNVMVRLWDLAPDGKATMFNENVALLEKSGTISFDLKSTDWTFEQGHRLGVQIGTIVETDDWGWLDVPSGNTIKVTGAQLNLSVQNPRYYDVPTQGGRAPYLDAYLAANTTTLGDVGPGTFPLKVSQG
uniref:CocE/NonD family hydrolase n=1 Tax=Nonomuraea bangladeshensis TaxID=404385 RepID=UPI003F494D98